MKYCPPCKRMLPVEAFHRNKNRYDGRASECKECKIAYMHSRVRSGHGVELRERDRGRYQRHREEKLARDSARRKGTHRPSGSPEKQRARQKLRYAVRAGRIQRPAVCGDCGENTTRIHAHHHDYSKPFDVLWLCPGCHGKQHRKDVAA